MSAERRERRGQTKTIRDFDMSVPLDQRFDQVFGEGSHKYSNVRDKLLNEKVGNDVAWEEAQPLLQYVESNSWVSIQDDVSPVRKLFDQARIAYFSLIKEEFKSDPQPKRIRQEYRLRKREVLGPMEDTQFHLTQVFVNIFERGLFKGMLQEKKP